MSFLKKFKSFICITMILMLVAMAGCTLNGGTNGDATQLYVGYFEGGYYDVHWKSWEKLYNETYPDEKIELLLEGDPTYGSAIENLLMTGDTPDIMTSPMNWRKFAAKGWLEPLGDVVTNNFNETMSIENAINDEISSQIKFKNEYFAFPFSEFMTGFAVNKGFFDEQGWDLPVTMDDMIDIIDKIAGLPENHDANTENDIYPFSWSGREAQYYWNYILNSWWANYGGIAEIKTFKNMESPEVYSTEAKTKAVEALLTLIGGSGSPKNCVPGAIGLDNTESQMMFISGKALMCPNASWLEVEMLQNTPEGFEMVLIAPPSIGGANEQNLYGHVDEWLIIPQSAQNKELAKKFVSFIFSEKGLLDFFKNTNTTSTFKVDYNKIEKSSLTEWGKSVLELRFKKNIFYSESNSPLMYMGFASFWQSKQITEMVTEGKSAASIIKYDYDQVSSSWDSWQIQI